MIEVKHTPGPWKAYNCDVQGERKIGDDGVRFWEVTAEGRYRGNVCNVHSALNISGISIAERDANARLIAAAPNMLEALAWVYNNTTSDSAHNHVAKAAIAKARGEA